MCAWHGGKQRGARHPWERAGLGLEYSPRFVEPIRQTHNKYKPIRQTPGGLGLSHIRRQRRVEGTHSNPGVRSNRARGGGAGAGWGAQGGPRSNARGDRGR
jgi:hypothetical protein